MEWLAHPPLEGGGGVSKNMFKTFILDNINNKKSKIIIQSALYI